MQSGPFGGDQQIGARIADGRIIALIFLVDPLVARPHEADVQALLRIAQLAEIPTATNVATAELIAQSLAWEPQEHQAEPSCSEDSNTAFQPQLRNGERARTKDNNKLGLTFVVPPPAGGGPRRSCLIVTADARIVMPRSCSSGVSSNVTVLAVELMQTTISLLRHNFELFGVPGKAVHAAASSTAGSVKTYVSSAGEEALGLGIRPTYAQRRAGVSWVRQATVDALTQEAGIGAVSLLSIECPSQR